MKSGTNHIAERHLQEVRDKMIRFVHDREQHKNPAFISLQREEGRLVRHFNKLKGAEIRKLEHEQAIVAAKEKRLNDLINLNNAKAACLVQNESAQHIGFFGRICNAIRNLFR